MTFAFVKNFQVTWAKQLNYHCTQLFSDKGALLSFIPKYQHIMFINNLNIINSLYTIELKTSTWLKWLPFYVVTFVFDRIEVTAMHIFRIFSQVIANFAHELFASLLLDAENFVEIVLMSPFRYYIGWVAFCWVGVAFVGLVRFGIRLDPVFQPIWHLMPDKIVDFVRHFPLI